MKTDENVVLKVAAYYESHKSSDVIEIGESLVGLGCDELTTGGFWIWDIEKDIEFYSPKFRASLGFKNELDFPSVPTSWQKQINPKDLEIAIDNYNKHLSSKVQHPYYQKVTYTTKIGQEIEVLCSGTIVKNNLKKPIAVIGSHKIL